VTILEQEQLSVKQAELETSAMRSESQTQTYEKTDRKYSI